MDVRKELILAVEENTVPSDSRITGHSVHLN
jgi:hypothetical protein